MNGTSANILVDAVVKDDAVGEVEWILSVDSTVVREHQHAAGARKKGAAVAVEAIALLFSHDPIFAVESSWFSEQFPANVRSSGISLGYDGASLVAGFLPLLAVAAYGWIGWTPGRVAAGSAPAGNPPSVGIRQQQ